MNLKIDYLRRLFRCLSFSTCHKCAHHPLWQACCQLTNSKDSSWTFFGSCSCHCSAIVFCPLIPPTLSIITINYVCSLSQTSNSFISSKTQHFFFIFFVLCKVIILGTINLLIVKVYSLIQIAICQETSANEPMRQGQLNFWCIQCSSFM